MVCAENPQSGDGAGAGVVSLAPVDQVPSGDRAGCGAAEVEPAAGASASGNAALINGGRASFGSGLRVERIPAAWARTRGSASRRVAIKAAAASVAWGVVGSDHVQGVDRGKANSGIVILQSLHQGRNHAGGVLAGQPASSVAAALRCAADPVRSAPICWLTGSACYPGYRDVGIGEQPGQDKKQDPAHSPSRGLASFNDIANSGLKNRWILIKDTQFSFAGEARRPGHYWLRLRRLVQVDGQVARTIHGSNDRRAVRAKLVLQEILVPIGCIWRPSPLASVGFRVPVLGFWMTEIRYLPAGIP